MTYILISKQLNSEEPPKRIEQDFVKTTWIDFEIKNLQENTWYQFDVELRDKGSSKPGPTMREPLKWKTKGEL